MYKEYSIELGGRTLTLEFGKYAGQANGSTFVRYGDTCVLVTATVADAPRPGIDFFPLSVDFEEKLYSVGHIPGSWNRREGRPAEKAILTSRLIDRPLRPLFPKGMRHDVSVNATVMSVEQDNSPEICAMNGASAALCISCIPFAGPIGAVRVGYVDGEYIINPTVEQRAQRAVDQAAGQYGLLSRTALAAVPGTGDVAHGIQLLFKIHAQGEEIDARTGGVGHGGGDQYAGVAVAHEGRAAGLLGVFAKFKGERPPAQFHAIALEHSDNSPPWVCQCHSD